MFSHIISSLFDAYICLYPLTSRVEITHQVQSGHYPYHAKARYISHFKMKEAPVIKCEILFNIFVSADQINHLYFEVS